VVQPNANTHRVQITSTIITAPQDIPLLLPTDESTLVGLLQQQKLEDQWAVDTVACPDEGADFASAIIQGTATAISDGSYKDGVGASAFILRDDNRDIRIQGVNAVPGQEETQSAYPSELSGVSGSLAIIESSCKLHNVQTGQVTIGLDGEQALIAASSTWPLHADQADFDLLCYIRAKVAKLPITIRWKWIEAIRTMPSTILNWTLSPRRPNGSVTKAGQSPSTV
jgi:hypothetical protein